MLLKIHGWKIGIKEMGMKFLIKEVIMMLNLKRKSLNIFEWKKFYKIIKLKK